MRKLLIVVLCLLGTAVTGTILSAEEPLQPPRPTRPDRTPGGLELPAQPAQPTPPASFGPGLTQVTLQLQAAPLAAIFQRALRDGRTLPEALQAVRLHRAEAERARQALIAILVAPPFNARIIGSTMLASHTLIVEVDAALIPQIRALPGVLAVHRDQIVPLDGDSAPAPPGGPSLGPVLN